MKHIGTTKVKAYIGAIIVAFCLPGAAQAQSCAQYTMQSVMGLESSGTLVETPDGPMCTFFRLTGGAPVGVDDRGFFTAADFSAPECPMGRFDGVKCFLRLAPPGEFVFANGFHAVPIDGGCPYNMIFDGVNCFWARAPSGTQAISEEGKWYITPRGSCRIQQFDPKGAPLPDVVLGAFDGTACRVAGLSTAPTQHLVLETEQGFFAAARLP